MSTRATSVAFAAMLGQAAAFSFVTLGDWGGAALGDFHPQAVKDVANQMAASAAERDTKFVVNVGDNFYYCGIRNLSDYQINADYTSVFTAPSLQVPWYSALGNHEYGWNVDAQLQFTQADPTKRWYLPARYYTKRVELTTGKFMTLIVTDTNPCIADYRASSPSKWDPCGSDFPTCDPIDASEACHFNENILSQDCAAQYNWLKDQLAAVDKQDWLVIVGHHPLDEVDVEDFTGAVQQNGFDLYLNGHVHTLQHYTVDGQGAYVTSGAGSMVRTADQHLDARCLASTADNQTVAGGFGHRANMLWEKKVAGFTRHTFNDDFTALTTEFISSTGEVLQTFTVNKGTAQEPSEVVV